MVKQRYMEEITFLNENGVIHYKAGEIKQAFELWSRAAAGGSVSAMYGIATIYADQGNIVDADVWYKKAADAGNRNALIKLEKNKQIFMDENIMKCLEEEKTNSGNFQDTIEFAGNSWFVLDKKKNKQLLLAKDIIDIRRYNETLQSVTWAASSLRKWLNGDFLLNLKPEEQEQIVVTKLINDGNEEYDICAEMWTEDRVFILSYSEVLKYYGDAIKGGNEDMLIANINMTSRGLLEAEKRYQLEYSKINGMPLGWWLRTSGKTAEHAMRVNCQGKIRKHGRQVNRNLEGVRPAMWIRR